MNDLIEFVNQHRVKTVPTMPKNDMCELQDQLLAAQEAKFTALEAKLSYELNLQTFFDMYRDKIILKTPPFQKMPYFSSYTPKGLENVTNIWYINRKEVYTEYVVLETKVKPLGLFKGTIMYPTKCLFEVPTQVYKQNVPINVLKAVTEARKNNLTPRVWFISAPSEFQDYVTKPADPLAVGYPKLNDNSYVVVLGIWGKDIEDLDKYFGAN